MSELSTKQKLAALRKQFGRVELVHPGSPLTTYLLLGQGNHRIRVMFAGVAGTRTHDPDLLVNAAFAALITPVRKRNAELEQQLAEVTEREEETRWWLEWLMGEVSGGGTGPYEGEVQAVIEHLDLKSRPPFSRSWGDDLRHAGETGRVSERRASKKRLTEPVIVNYGGTRFGISKSARALIGIAGRMAITIAGDRVKLVPCADADGFVVAGSVFGCAALGDLAEDCGWEVGDQRVVRVHDGPDGRWGEIRP